MTSTIVMTHMTHLPIYFACLREKGLVIGTRVICVMRHGRGAKFSGAPAVHARAAWPAESRIDRRMKYLVPLVMTTWLLNTAALLISILIALVLP